MSSTHFRRPARHGWAARSAYAALAVLALVDVLGLVLAVGHAEYRITVGTHGQPDVWPAAAAYVLFAHVVDRLGDALGFPVEAGTVRGVTWAVALLVALVAVSVWRSRVGRTPRWARATLGWLGATVLLKVASALYDIVAAAGTRSVDGALAGRPVAYSLWTVSTVVLVVAVRRVAGSIRRTAEAEARSGNAASLTA